MLMTSGLLTTKQVTLFRGEIPGLILPSRLRKGYETKTETWAEQWNRTTFRVEEVPVLLRTHLETQHINEVDDGLEPSS